MFSSRLLVVLLNLRAKPTMNLLFQDTKSYPFVEVTYRGEPPRSGGQVQKMTPNPIYRSLPQRPQIRQLEMQRPPGTFDMSAQQNGAAILAPRHGTEHAYVDEDDNRENLSAVQQQNSTTVTELSNPLELTPGIFQLSLKNGHLGYTWRAGIESHNEHLASRVTFFFRYL